MEAIVSDVPFRWSRYFRHLVQRVGALTNVLQMIEYQEEKVPQAFGDQQKAAGTNTVLSVFISLLNREDAVCPESVLYCRYQYHRI